MSRSIKKGIYIDEKLMKKVRSNIDNKDKKSIKTWARRSTIVPEMIGMTIEIHNGKIHIPVLIEEGMVGHKLGEFSPTRTFRGHSTKKKV